jgi:hypothetical protein
MLMQKRRLLFSLYMCVQEKKLDLVVKETNEMLFQFIAFLKMHWSLVMKVAPLCLKLSG